MPDIKNQQLEARDGLNKGDEVVLKDLGQIIHDTRIAEGISQEELSKRSGISRYYISSIERGAKNVTVIVLRRLSSVLKLHGWQLLKKAEEKI